MAGFGQCGQLASRPSFPARRTLRLDSEATQAQFCRSCLTPSRSAALANRPGGTSSQVQRFWPDVQDPRGIHVEAAFKTKRRNGTIALLMPLTSLPPHLGRDTQGGRENPTPTIHPPVCDPP
jgi:hypothetical protein